MTISLLALLSLLLLAFYLHDVQCIKAELNRIADRGTAQEWNREQLEEEIEKSIKEIPLLFIQIEKTTAEENKRKKILTVEFNTLIPSYIKWFYRDFIQEGTIQVSVERFCPEQFIRQTEAGKEVLK